MIKLNTSGVRDLSTNVYYKMMSSFALNHSGNYLMEERHALETTLKSITIQDNMNFIVVGGAALTYVDLISQYKGLYTCIDPFLDLFIHPSLEAFFTSNHRTHLLKYKFEDVAREQLPPCNSFFIFHFNIVAHLENPLETINKLMRKGDRFFISQWGTNKHSHQLRERYFQCIDDDEAYTRAKLAEPFASYRINHFKKCQVLEGNVTHIQVVET